MSKDENKKKKDVKNNSKFLKESRAELKRVSWPKPKSLVNDTLTVIVIVLVVALIVFVLDLAFLKLNEKVIIETEQKIVNSVNNTEEQKENSESNNETENSENEESQESGETENSETTENSEAE